MKQILLSITILLLLHSCQPKSSAETSPDKIPAKEFKLYSTSVKDSFYLQVRLPKVPLHPEDKFPLLIVLDGNFHFPSMASVVQSYGEVQLLANAVVVGLGYKDFGRMDSLRSRDYTFPKALPEYEMEPSGGAPAFLQFLKTELIPELRKNYPCNENVYLYGHSLAGFFCLYALKEQWAKSESTFAGFISGSPSLHYNRYSLLTELEQLSADTSKKQQAEVFVGFGSKEDDPEDTAAMPLAEVLSRLEALDPSGAHIRTGLFTPLEHMETPLPVLQRGWSILKSNYLSTTPCGEFHMW